MATQKQTPEPALPDSICDRCSEPVRSDESQNGPEGTQWENANICNECYAEVDDTE